VFGLDSWQVWVDNYAFNADQVEVRAVCVSKINAR
jgi:hypothetical protein